MSISFSARQIAGILGGQIEGDENIVVNRLAKIEEGTPGSLTFLANPKYTQFIYTTKSSIVITNRDFVPERPLTCALIKVEDAYGAFAILLERFNLPHYTEGGISEHATISATAKVDSTSFVGPYVFIGENAGIGKQSMILPQVYIGNDVQIGNNTTVYPGVRIYQGSRIGNDCIIHAGVVIGSDGFGFAPQKDQNFKKVPQIGNVIIEDYVEIGANTTIDRATVGSTIIRKGVKLDNLIQIAHNVEIGENTVIAAQTGISGSTKIGRNCMIAGQVGITGHLHIGNDVKIGAQSGISTNIRDGETVLGSPAFDIEKYRKSYVHFRNLDKHIKKLEEISQFLLHNHTGK